MTEYTQVLSEGKQISGEGALVSMTRWQILLHYWLNWLCSGLLGNKQKILGIIGIRSEGELMVAYQGSYVVKNPKSKSWIWNCTIKVLKKSWNFRKVRKCDCLTIENNSFFNFLISSGLSDTSLRYFWRVVRSGKSHYLKIDIVILIYSKWTNPAYGATINGSSSDQITYNSQFLVEYPVPAHTHTRWKRCYGSIRVGLRVVMAITYILPFGIQSLSRLG